MSALWPLADRNGEANTLTASTFAAAMASSARSSSSGLAASNGTSSTSSSRAARASWARVEMVVGSTSTAIRRARGKIPNFRGTQKSHNPLSEVAVRDMKTGEITPVSYKPGII